MVTMIGPRVIFKIIVLLISFNLTRSAFDCERLETRMTNHHRDSQNYCLVLKL